MGNLAFDISKIVDLNKTVNLDIDKNVDVNVNIDDLLATAEADAEAFGTFALAEVDAYTFVNEDGGTQIFEDVVVDVDALGNTTLTDQTDLIEEAVTEPITGNTYDIPQNITVNFTTPDGEGLPDIDDLNWTGGLSGNAGVQGDTQIPTDPDETGEPGFSPRSDKVLELDDLSLSAELQPNGSVIVFAEYELTQDWIVHFGERTITGDIKSDTQDLSIRIPAGTTYLVEFLDEDGDPATGVEGFEAKEYEFEAFPDNQPGQWEFGTQSFDIETYVQVGEEIFDIGFGDWDFQALGTITINGIPDGDGEAFAYAESTSAVDLNGDGTDVL